MQMITDGIVIKENDVGEYDRAITVLTRDFGIIHAFAVGARRLKSKKNTSTSLLAYSRFSFADNGKSIRVDEATPIEMFFPLRYDIVRLSAAQYICELCGTLAPREEPAEMFLRIVLNTIFFLTQPERDPHILLCIAEMQLLCLSGYQPDLVGCTSCGSFEKGKMYFSVSDANIICSECDNIPTVDRYELDKELLFALRHITYSPIEKIFTLYLSPEKAKYLAKVVEAYTLSRTERSYKSLEFLHTVDI